MRKLYKDKRGSITLEAAVFMPFFIFFLVFLIILIRFAIVDIALNQAVSETTKQISTQAYPIERIVDTVSGIVRENEYVQEIESEILDAKNQLEIAIGEDDFQELIVNPAKEAGGSFVGAVGGLALKPIIVNQLESLSAINLINPEKINVNIVDLPTEGNGYFIGIVVEYEFDLSLPFFEKTYIVRKKSYERLWVGA